MLSTSCMTQYSGTTSKFDVTAMVTAAAMTIIQGRLRMSSYCDGRISANLADIS